jgi:hypothetical protein
MKVHGPFRVEVSSATKYGLLERLGGGKIQPTDLSKRVLRPQSPQDEVQGYREAILNAPDISNVYKHYRGENLPDAQFLKNTVVDTYSIPSEKFEEFNSIFMDSLKTARLLSKHGDKVRILDVTEDEPTSNEKSDRIRELGRKAHVEAGDTCFVMQPFAAPGVNTMRKSTNQRLRRLA